MAEGSKPSTGRRRSQAAKPFGAYRQDEPVRRRPSFQGYDGDAQVQTSQAYRRIWADAGKVSVLFQLMAVRRSAAAMIHQGKGAWLWGYCQFRQA